MTQPASQDSHAPRPARSADPVADLSQAPLPTPRTLRRRRNLALQFTRFLAFNARIMRMVLKGHADSH